MNKVDKIKINSMLASIDELTKLKSMENKKYIDKKVADFVYNACNDYNSNKTEIIDIIKKNKKVLLTEKFLPISHLKHDYPYGVAKEWVQFGYATGFYAVMSINWTTAEYIIHDVRFYTSDTNDARYRVCSGCDYLDNQNNDVVREVRNAKAIGTSHTAEWWKKAYEIAVNTKKKNECMVSAFTTFLEYVAACIGHDAEKAQDAKAFLKTKVEVYTKVKI